MPGTRLGAPVLSRATGATEISRPIVKLVPSHVVRWWLALPLRLPFPTRFKFRSAPLKILRHIHEFTAAQSGHVALIWSDIALFARSHGWTGLVSGQAWNTGSAVWRCGSLRESCGSNDTPD
jgi:hypothetical protein